MKTFFPEMDKEIADDRLAEKREARQLAQKTLRENAGLVEWILKRLREKGPMLDMTLAYEINEIVHGSKQDTIKLSMMPMVVAYAMWLDRQLWRKEFYGHPCGQKCFTYGIRVRHRKPEICLVNGKGEA